MKLRWHACLLVAVLGLWAGSPAAARAQDYTATPKPDNYNLSRFWYYPYYYFPHNYWPMKSPPWPEPQGAAYMRPPAYMAYPALKEPHWRYELWEPQTYHRGFHFWLDQF